MFVGGGRRFCKPTWQSDGLVRIIMPNTRTQRSYDTKKTRMNPPRFPGYAAVMARRNRDRHRHLGSRNGRAQITKRLVWNFYSLLELFMLVPVGAGREAIETPRIEQRSKESKQKFAAWQPPPFLPSATLSIVPMLLKPTVQGDTSHTRVVWWSLQKRTVSRITLFIYVASYGLRVSAPGEAAPHFP